MNCKHTDFTAVVNVFVLEDIQAHRADIKIVCKQCGEPFEFIGFPLGLLHDQATVSMDGTELRVPIKPVGAETRKYAGFGVKCVSDEPIVKGTA